MTPSIHGYSMAPVSSTTQPQSMAPTNFPAYTSAPGGQLAQQQPFSMPYGHLTTTPSQMGAPQPNHLYYSAMNMQQRPLSNQGQLYNNGQSQPPHPQAAMGLPGQTISGQNTPKTANITCYIKKKNTLQYLKLWKLKFGIRKIGYLMS